jgi:hypothetical protein
LSFDAAHVSSPRISHKPEQGRTLARRFTSADFSLVVAAGRGDQLLMVRLSFQHSSVRLTRPVE